MQFFATAAHDDVLLAQLDQLHRMADGMRATGAGRADHMTAAADIESMRKARGERAAHAAWHDEGRQLAGAAVAETGERDLVFAQGGTATHHQAAAGRLQISGAESGLCDGFTHGLPGIPGGGRQKTAQLARRFHQRGCVHRTADLAAHAERGKAFHVTDATTRVAQRIEQGRVAGAHARHRTHARHHDARLLAICAGTAHAAMALKISEVLMPPNAKLLFITYGVSIRRPSPTM